jgi:drug/metabolite transporter (DMT)-like permease
MTEAPLSISGEARKSVPGGLAAIHIAVFLFGLAGLLGKMLTLPPPVIVFSRALLAALALGSLLWIRNASRPPKSPHWFFFAVTGSVLAVHWLTFFKSIQVSTVAIGLISFSSFPLFVTLFEPVAFRERLRAFDLMTCLLVIAGLVLVAPNFDLSQHPTQGVVWGTASGLTFAVLSILNRKYVRGIPPLAMGAGQNAVAAVLLLPFVCGSGIHMTLRDAMLLVVLGLLCTACGHVLFIRGLATVRAQVASVLTGLEPLYGSSLAWIVLQEVPPLRTLLGGLLILGAIILAGFAPPRNVMSNENRLITL